MGIKLTNYQPSDRELDMITKQVLGFFDLLENQDNIILQMILGYLSYEEVTTVCRMVNRKLNQTCENPSFLNKLISCPREFLQTQDLIMFQSENLNSSFQDYQ